MASLGCPKNQVDAEMILSKLKDKGYEITPYEQEAQVIIVNTCGFIESAKQESINTVLELAELKKDRKAQMPDRYGLSCRAVQGTTRTNSRNRHRCKHWAKRRNRRHNRKISRRAKDDCFEKRKIFPFAAEGCS